MGGELPGATITEENNSIGLRPVLDGLEGIGEHPVPDLQAGLLAGEIVRHHVDAAPHAAHADFLAAFRKFLKVRTAPGNPSDVTVNSMSSVPKKCSRIREAAAENVLWPEV